METHLRLHFALLAILMSLYSTSHAQDDIGRWTADRANQWYVTQAWLVGANFVPSTAINQLEMFQADTFDPETIDRELGWAANIGFNTMRVYLHDLLWTQDKEGFLHRTDQYLAIADKHGIKTMLVLFDAVWDPHPKLGPQREPKPGVHNSGWVQGPHIDILKDEMRHEEVKPYVIGVLSRFADDARVLAWDLYNEPGNKNVLSYGNLEPPNKVQLGQSFLEKLFTWAREVNPSQPLTAGVWLNPGGRTDPPHPLDALMIENSDVITFHSYMPLAGTKNAVDWLQTFDRPIICTEYMARAAGSRFETILPYFKAQNIGAINWGLVSGKSQTIYPWGSWNKPLAKEPQVWFHDVFRKDGSPFDEAEVTLIKSLTERD
jgi:hypothetical protein